jgi:DNA invertase Pin-like site-specific DNA recombinase
MKTTEALKIFGSVRGIAKALGISVQAVHRWGDSVPHLRAYQIRDLQVARGCNV